MSRVLSNNAKLKKQVIEYLIKKGYSRTEQTLRQESSNVDKDGKPIRHRVEDIGNGKYAKAFQMLSAWIDQNLDIYKYELRRVLWPIFVYSFLELIEAGHSEDGQTFFQTFQDRFEQIHADELRIFETITLPQHVSDNTTTKLYRNNKYRIPLNTHVYFNLMTFLESKSAVGGSVIIFLLSCHCEVRETSRGPIDQYSFEAIIYKAHHTDGEDSDLQEGIPGAFTGVTNQDIMHNNTILKLGMPPMEPELAQDVRAELEDEDLRNPAEFGRPSLVEEFDQNIKREDSSDGPTRNEIPLPPSRARDVMMEVQKIRENRDRFKIEGRTGGIGPGVSVCMFTFHNTLDAITCIEFSDDSNLVAVGTEESYIRVWHLHGEALPSIVPTSPNSALPSNSRRLIGHSAPVYSVSFSPSTASSGNDTASPSTNPKLLLSSSSDKTVRLWSLEAWTCLVVYKGHEGPVWGVRWGPFGHYFATCGWDKTVRVWGQDHISYLRMMVGHDSNVNQIAWHPNGAYIFSASDQADKTVRMWSFVTGDCVRIFTGHTDFISALECSPNGKILASADAAGSIILWDLAKGTQIKRCKGHGKGGIWSLSFSAESTVLASGGADGTVRIWDIEVPTDPFKNGDGEIIGVGGQADATRINGSTTTGSQPAAVVGGSKKKGKDTTITPDQISAFPTKKSPVYKVKFTRMNLVMAGKKTLNINPYEAREYLKLNSSTLNWLQSQYNISPIFIENVVNGSSWAKVGSACFNIRDEAGNITQIVSSEVRSKVLDILFYHFQEQHGASLLPSESLTDTFETLHQLSKTWHIIYEDLVDFEERLDFLADVFKKYSELLALSPENATHESLRYIQSQIRIWRRWASSYNLRTKVRIDLFFNLASQNDNRTNLEIANTSKSIATSALRDSSAMTTIAALTMLFLPGTFICAIFSMVFFNSEPDGSGKIRLQVLPCWWYFPAFAIPLTMAVFAVWGIWLRIREKNTFSKAGLPGRARAWPRNLPRTIGL
ncbi:hypothetical protein B7494_g2599 [Chlorociboria aeruginascens]|nr:hypothetical protein B7494_g2599 [Chlorociboria aeruginascens]